MAWLEENLHGPGMDGTDGISPKHCYEGKARRADGDIIRGQMISSVLSAVQIIFP